jgi:hypothetical protein
MSESSAHAEDHAHADMGMPPEESRSLPLIRARGRISIPSPTTEAVDAAIAGLGADRGESDRAATDPPVLQAGKDDPSVAPVCLSLCLVAARWPSPRRPSQQPDGRRAIRRVAAVRRASFVKDVILADPS